jgi:hypothetical protein
MFFSTIIKLFITSRTSAGSLSLNGKKLREQDDPIENRRPLVIMSNVPAPKLIFFLLSNAHGQDHCPKTTKLMFKLKLIFFQVNYAQSIPTYILSLKTTEKST